MNNRANYRIVAESFWVLWQIIWVRVCMCVLSLELGCPLLLALQEHCKTSQQTNKKKQAESKYQQVVLVMFGVGLSGDPTKAVGKWQSGTGSRYTHEPWACSDGCTLVHTANLNLQQCLSIWSCLSGLGWNGPFLWDNEGKQRCKAVLAEWVSDIADWEVSCQESAEAVPDGLCTVTAQRVH